MQIFAPIHHAADLGVIFTWPAHGLRFAAQCQRFLEMGKK
jgi:hypothetical protein